MTRYVLAFACLVALSASASSNTVPTIYLEKGENFENIGIEEKHQERVASCEIKDNHGENFILFPQNQKVDSPDKFILNKYNKCKLKIYRLTEKDEGKWEVRINRTHGIKSETVSYNVKIREIYKKINVFPASRLEVHNNRQVSVHLVENFDKLKSCKVLSPQNVEHDLKSGVLEGVEPTSNCGFKMTVQEKYVGVWTLIADLNNNTAFYASVHISTKTEDDIKPNTTYYTFKLGEKGEIKGGYNGKMCILENPHGKRFSISIGSCSHTIPSVTKSDEGIWKAYYGVDDLENLIEHQIVVRTYDAKPLNSSVTHLPNGDINLLCQVQGTEMNYCLFTRPDGKILQMSTTVINKKYEYFGSGTSGSGGLFPSALAIDCGITIHQPSNDDYGAWKCLVNFKPAKWETTTMGRILKVLPSTAHNSRAVTSNPGKDVFVKRGDSYQVKCSANEVLSYCWLRSPNGTVHTVFKSDDVRPPQLKYEGNGLELGDCTARIEEATETDAGNWTCHMGVANGPELEAGFRVHVGETNLMALQDTVHFSSKSTAELVCRPLPGSNKVIESCRWICPQGHGLHVERSERYFTETQPSYCRLSMHSASPSVDAGEWRCFARFANTLEEGNAKVTVVYSSRGIGAYFSNALVISLIATSAFFIFLIVACRRRNAATEYDEKIILEKPSKFP